MSDEEKTAGERLVEAWRDFTGPSKGKGCPRNDADCAKLGRCRKWCEHVQRTNKAHRARTQAQLDAQGEDDDDAAAERERRSHYRAKPFHGVY